MEKRIDFTFAREVEPDPIPPPEPARVVGWRGLHVVEGGRAPEPMPNPGVIPPYDPTIKLAMTKSIQLMGYDVMAHFHPAVRADRNKWRIMHGGAVAMNNGPWNGYDHPKEPHPLADYVNNRDLSEPLPNYDKMQRTFAGSLITGRLEGNLIWCTPGVDAIDARNFVYQPGTPEAQATLGEILAKRWIGFGVAESETGVFKIRGQWGEGIIAFPFILDRPVAYEAKFFAAWDETYYPNPLLAYI